MDFFSGDHSPNHPICVYNEWIIKSKEPFEAVLDLNSFRIAEAPEDFHHEASRTLARIRHQEYSSRLIVFIQGEEGEVDDWDKVISITKNIIAKIREFEYEIISVVPTELMPAEFFPAEKLANKPYDPVGSEIKTSQQKKTDLPISPKGSKIQSSCELDDIPKYGTFRNLSTNQVKEIVRRCKDNQAQKISVKKFYLHVISKDERRKYALDTLKGWLRDKKFYSDK